MTKRTRNRNKSKQVSGSQVRALEKRINNLSVNAKKPRSRKKNTPFGDVGTMVGRSIGGMFGNSSVGSGIGRWLGTGIGSIFGSGDYQVTGNMPKYNVLANGSQIPQFSTGRQTNVVCHREYLGDFNGTAGFSNNVFALNPGIASTFPWLSTVAANYQEYRFHGLVFEFRSLITDFVTGGAPGVIVMSTNYNADAPNYVSKQQMENAEYAVSTKPTVNLLHGIECATNQTILPERYVRTGAVSANQDLRLYDLGNFQFATQANPIQDLGELWVSYCVEFFKPILPIGGGLVSSVHFGRTGVAALTPFGTATNVTNGSIQASITSTVFTFAAVPQQNYMLTIFWNQPGPAAFTMPVVTVVGGGSIFVWGNGTIANAVSPVPAGTVTNSATFSAIIKCTLLNPGNITVTAGVAGVIAAASTVDIHLTEYDATFGNGM